MMGVVLVRRALFVTVKCKMLLRVRFDWVVTEEMEEKGEVVEGSEDDIQAVDYLWAMQLTPKEFVAEDGRKYQAQTWLLREQIMRGVMAIVG